MQENKRKIETQASREEEKNSVWEKIIIKSYQRGYTNEWTRVRRMCYCSCYIFKGTKQAARNTCKKYVTCPFTCPETHETPRAGKSQN